MDRRTALQSLQSRLAALSTSSSTSSVIALSARSPIRDPSGRISRTLTPADLSLLLKKPSLHLVADDRIVLDIGSLYTKIGLASEHSPRFVLQNRVLNINASLDSDKLTQFWNESFAMTDVPIVELYLHQHLFEVFFRYLLTDPKDKTIIICENAMMPILLKQTIAAVLLEHFQVASVQFALTPSMIMLTMGIDHGLVVDCGSNDTQVVPIYDSRPLLSSVTTVPLAGIHTIHHLADLLIQFGTLLSPMPDNESTTINHLVSDTTHITENQPRTPLRRVFWLKAANWALGDLPNNTETGQPIYPKGFIPILWTQNNAVQLLTLGFLEDFKTRCCFIGSCTRPDDYILVQEPIPEELMESSIPPAPQSEYIPLFSQSESFTPRGVYKSTNNFSQSTQRLVSKYKIYKSHATTIYYPLGEHGVSIGGNANMKLIVPGWVRERAAEVLFEKNDDGHSIVTCVLDCLLKLANDLRKPLANNIILSGGTTHSVGFISRLHEELLFNIISNERYKSLRGLTSDICLRTPGHGQFQCGAWVGTSLAANLKLINPAAEITREQFQALKANASSINPDEGQKSLLLPSVFDWTLALGAHSGVSEQIQR